MSANRARIWLLMAGYAAVAASVLVVAVKFDAAARRSRLAARTAQRERTKAIVRTMLRAVRDE